MPRAAAKKPPRTPLLEWVAASIGLIFLLVVLGAIGHDALTGASDRPPAIMIERKKVVAFEGGYIVHFVARNKSGGTAAALEVEGQLNTSDGSVETSHATLDYVPGDGQAEGGLYFSSDPRSGRLAIRALGYQAP